MPHTSGMFAPERRHYILEALTREGRVEVASLAAALDVSEDTVRRDLKALTEQGFLQKTHGGAVLLATARVPFPARHQVRTDSKAAIGQHAARHVEPGQTLFIDAGTTTLELARHLPAVELTVVTNSLDVASALADRAGLRLILCGGEWYGAERYFSGPAAEAAIAGYRADLAFIGACAVHPRHGLTATGASDARIKAAMIHQAERALLLADASKFGHITSHGVAPLSAFDRLVTDEAPPWAAAAGLAVEVTATAT